MSGELLIAPEIGSLAGFGAFGIVVIVHVVAASHAESHASAKSAATFADVSGSVKAVSGIEHVVVIYGNGDDRHRDAFVDEIRLGRGVCCLAVYKFRTPYNRVFGNMHVFRNLFRFGSGVGSVECTADFASFLRGERFDGEARIESGSREDACFRLVVVVVFLEAARG